MRTDITKISTQKLVSEDFREFPVSTNQHLNDRQLEAIRLLVIGRSIATVSSALGIDPRTLYNWRQDNTFKRELNRLRRRLWAEAADRLRALVHPSLDVLEAHLRKRHERTRYRAANAVLRHANLKKCVPL